jgi:hypothetical protein
MTHLEITIETSIEKLLNSEDSDINLVAYRVLALSWWNIEEPPANETGGHPRDHSGGR